MQPTTTERTTTERTSTERTSTERSPSPIHGDLHGLRVAVTGGTSGLGRALVEQLTARGASVAFTARTSADVEHLATTTGAVGIVGDIGAKHDTYPTAMQVTGNLGGLDVLINNASSLGAVPLRPLADTDCEDLEAALATNLVGPFRLTKALFGALVGSARADGRPSVVVNISSDAAITAYPTWGAYGASKAGLAHLTDIWDAEGSDFGVRFTSVDPGDMDTPLHALADPETDPATLRRPGDAAAEVIDRIVDLRAVDQRAEVVA